MRNEVFERLYAEHARPLLAFLTYRTGDPALAEDLLADTFERVLRARRRFDPRQGTEKAWLYTIALNLLRDNIRRQATEKRSVESVSVGVPGSVAPTDLIDHRDELRTAMARLSDDEREVVALRFGADLTVPEIARLLKLKVPAAEGRLYRALGKLRQVLKPESAMPG